ncbi:phosphoglycerate kinase, partial [PVC group bacterium]|nr:phosphoglycerate kinase [PVC group bacterium]
EMDADGNEKLVWKDACLNGVKDIQEGFAGVDIGPETSRIYAEEIQKAKTVIWNGPMGIFEEKPFSMGTLEVARACAASSEQGGLTVVGGGDSVAAVESLGYSQKITHISTGGGAALELLEGKTLPGLAVLEDKDA